MKTNEIEMTQRHHSGRVPRCTYDNNGSPDELQAQLESMTADAFPRIFFPAPWEFSGLFLKIFEQELKQKQAEAERSILLALGLQQRETKR